MATHDMDPASWWAERERLGAEFPPPPPHRMESLRGPSFSNWVIRGHLLIGPHPETGASGADSAVRSLRELLQEGVTTFVCLQDEMPPTLGASASSAGATGALYGTPSTRVRSAYGAGNVVTAKPYVEQAQMVAEAARLPQVAGGKQLSFLHVPIRNADGGVTTDAIVKRLVQDLVAHIKAGEMIYLHCSDGNGRSGTIASVLLGATYGMSSSEALDAVQRSRDFRLGTSGRSPETHEQKMQVHRVLGDDRFRESVAAVAPRRSGDSEEAESKEAAAVMVHVRKLLQRKGWTALCRFRAFLRGRCDVAPGRMSLQAASDALADAGFYLTPAETGVLLHNLDTTGSGTVLADAITNGVRGKMSSARRGLVLAAFRKMDHSNHRVVTLDDLAVSFDAEGHPEVRSGRRAPEEVTREFLETFGMDKRGREVTVEEFEDYWADISAACPDESLFKMILWGVWGLDGSELMTSPRTAGKGSQQARSGVVIQPASFAPPASLEEIYGGRKALSPPEACEALVAGLLKHGGEFAVAKVCGALRDLGAKAVAAGRAHSEDSDDGLIELAALRAALRGAGCPMTEDDERASSEFFSGFSDQAHGDGHRPSASSRALENALAGPLSDTRQRVIAQAFAALDSRWRGSGAIPARELAGMFRAERHPVVSAGRRTVDAVMRDFLASLGKGDPRDGLVRLPLFERVCTGISRAVDDDAAFSLVIWQCFDVTRGAVAIGSTTYRPATTADVHPGESVGARADQGEAGFLSHKEAMYAAYYGAADVSPAPATPSRGHSHRQHFASHPAKHTSAQVVGSTVAQPTQGGGHLVSPYASRAGYGLGGATVHDSVAISSGARLVVNPHERTPAISTSTVLDEAKMDSGGWGREDAFFYGRGGDRGRRPNRAAEMTLRADNTKELLVQAPDEADALRSSFALEHDLAHAITDLDVRVASVPRTEPEAVARARAQTFSRGVKGLFALLKWLGIGVSGNPELHDDPSSRSVNAEAFVRRLREHGLGLSERDAREIAAHCADATMPGNVQLKRVFEALCPPISSTRAAIASNAFDSLLKSAAIKAGAVSRSRPVDTVPMGHVRMAYASSKHPQVTAGRRSEADVLREFLETFFPMAPESASVGRSDFVQYYRAVCSALQQDDLFFSSMMWAVWDLQSTTATRDALRNPDKAGAVPAAGRSSAPPTADHLVGAAAVPSPSRGTAGSPVRRAAGGISSFEPVKGGSMDPASRSRGNLEHVGWTPAVSVAAPDSVRVSTAAAVCDRLQATISRRGPKSFLDLASHFRVASGNTPGSSLAPLTPEEFRGALTHANVGMSAAELSAIASEFAAPEPYGGCIDTERFLRAVVGNMSAARRDLVARAWAVASQGRDVVSSDDLCIAYRASYLPDVRAGRKTEREALREFLSPLLELGGTGAMSVDVDREIWFRHYSMVSAGMADDSAFRLMLWEAFGLGA
jgi:Ca2+-binding EF-hand superfamily protein